MFNKVNMVANHSWPKQGPKFEDPRQRGGLWRNGFVPGMGMELRLSREVAKLCTSAGLAHIMIEGGLQGVFAEEGRRCIEILMTAIAGELSGLGDGKMVKDGHGVLLAYFRYRS